MSKTTKPKIKSVREIKKNITIKEIKKEKASSDLEEDVVEDAALKEVSDFVRTISPQNSENISPSLEATQTQNSTTVRQTTGRDESKTDDEQLRLYESQGQEPIYQGYIAPRSAESQSFAPAPVLRNEESFLQRGAKRMHEEGIERAGRGEFANLQQLQTEDRRYEPGRQAGLEKKRREDWRR